MYLQRTHKTPAFERRRIAGWSLPVTRMCNAQPWPKRMALGCTLYRWTLPSFCSSCRYSVNVLHVLFILLARDSVFKDLNKGSIWQSVLQSVAASQLTRCVKPETGMMTLRLVERAFSAVACNHNESLAESTACLTCSKATSPRIIIKVPRLPCTAAQLGACLAQQAFKRHRALWVAFYTMKMQLQQAGQVLESKPARLNIEELQRLRSRKLDQQSSRPAHPEKCPAHACACSDPIVQWLSSA